MEGRKRLFLCSGVLALPLATKANLECAPGALGQQAWTCGGPWGYSHTAFLFIPAALIGMPLSAHPLHVAEELLVWEEFLGGMKLLLLNLRLLPCPSPNADQGVQAALSGSYLYPFL